MEIASSYNGDGRGSTLWLYMGFLLVPCHDVYSGTVRSMVPWFFYNCGVQRWFLLVMQNVWASMSGICWFMLAAGPGMFRDKKERKKRQWFKPLMVLLFSSYSRNDIPITIHHQH